jgi:hypothetical protein
LATSAAPLPEIVQKIDRVELADQGKLFLDVKEQTDVGHPASVLYQLLLGNRKGTRDKIDSGIVVTSLFLMDRKIEDLLGIFERLVRAIRVGGMKELVIFGKVRSEPAGKIRADG